MLTESYKEAFDTVLFSYIPVDLKINGKIVSFKSEANGYSVIFQKRKRIITTHQIKKIIEKHNPKIHYSLKLSPSDLVIIWVDMPLVEFKKRSFRVNLYGIGKREKVYEFYKELTKDIMKIYDPEIKI